MSSKSVSNGSSVAQNTESFHSSVSKVSQISSKPKKYKKPKNSQSAPKVIEFVPTPKVQEIPKVEKPKKVKKVRDENGNVNCENCPNCHNCENCKDMINCDSCIDSHDCKDSNKLRNCEYMDKCEKCTGSSYAYNCKYLMYSHYITNVVRAYKSSFCNECYMVIGAYNRHNQKYLIGSNQCNDDMNRPEFGGANKNCFRYKFLTKVLKECHIQNEIAQDIPKDLIDAEVHSNEEHYPFDPKDQELINILNKRFQKRGVTRKLKPKDFKNEYDAWIMEQSMIPLEQNIIQIVTHPLPVPKEFNFFVQDVKSPFLVPFNYQRYYGPNGFVLPDMDPEFKPEWEPMSIKVMKTFDEEATCLFKSTNAWGNSNLLLGEMKIPLSFGFSFKVLDQIPDDFRNRDDNDFNWKAFEIVDNEKMKDPIYAKENQFRLTHMLYY